MAENRQSLLDQLEKALSELTRMVNGLDDVVLDYKPTNESWSTREILAHLVDDEMYVMRLRAERIVKEDFPHLTPHDEKKWYANRNTTRDKLDELLADFALQRAASLRMLRMLRDSDWAREGIQPEYGRFSAEQWLSNWVGHDQAHLRQIEENLAAFRKA